MSLPSHSPKMDSATPHHSDIRISSLLNSASMSQVSSKSSKTLMPQSGLPTPDSTPVQELLRDASSGSSFHHSAGGEAIDPAVLPLHHSESEIRPSSLFPDSLLSPPKELVTPQRSSRPHRAASLPSSQALSTLRPLQHVGDGSAVSPETVPVDVAFAENVPAGVWYEYHAIDKAGRQRPATIVFNSQLWTSASSSVTAYAHDLTKTPHQTTFSSGKAPGLNWLSTVALEQQRLSPSSNKKRSRSRAKSNAEPDAKKDARPAEKRRPSLKKRSNVDGGEPEAKRMRAAAVHKEKPNSYDEVPNYSPPLSTFNAAHVKTLVPKGSRIDLSDDPLLDLIGKELNQQERAFAEVNQLDVNKYLINKRKIFQGRVQIYLQGKKSFTKTHAQQAAIIDVNKASRMWEFFEQAGWLDMKHFKKFIPAELQNMREKNMPIAKEHLE